MTTKTILVCGGRNFGDLTSKLATEEERKERRKQYDFVVNSLERIIVHTKQWHDDSEYLMPLCKIVSGAAKGPDNIAIDWAVTNWLPFKEYPADWSTYGKAAGHIRNKQMLDEENIDLVIAFPGGKGTANMIKQAKDRGIEVMEVSYP